MAIPATPTNLANGAVLTEAWVDSVRDWVVFDKGDRPLLKVAVITSIDDDTVTQVPFTTPLDAWTTDPIINRGGFDPAAGAPGYGTDMPDTGVYRIAGNVVFAAATSATQRYIQLIDDGNDITGGRARVGGYNSAVADTCIAVDTLHYFSAGDEFGMEVYQNTGAAMNIVATITAEWLGTTA